MILQMFKGLFTAFSFMSFMRFTLSLYICCSELSASQDFPRTRVFNKLNIRCIIARRVLTLSRYIALSRIDRYLSVFGFCSSCQFNFVVPTVECIRGYDIDLTI